MKKTRSRKPHPRQRALSSPHRPTISLCVIARDEERFIGDCLASARPFVDEMVVLDTGSVDATRKIAQTYGARVGTFEWCDDFAAARNASIDLATSDWIIVLDADERLQPASGPLLRAFVESKPTAALFYALRTEHRESDNPADYKLAFANRLFPRIPGLRFVGAIHEDLSYPPDPARASGLPVDFIRITHLGYLPELIEERGKLERNHRLLVLESVARPEDPLPWYYLALQELAADRLADAAEHLRRCLACSGTRPTFSTVDVYAQLIVAYTRLNDAGQLESIAAEAEDAGALSANARQVLAQGLIGRGLYLQAEQQLLRALEPNQPLELEIRAGIGGWLTRLILAGLYERMGNRQAALAQLEVALADAELGDRGDVARSAVRLALEVGDMASLSRCLDSWTVPDEADLDGQLQLLALRSVAGPASTTVGPLGPLDTAIALGDWQSAYDLALTLSGRTMAEAARLLFVSTRLQRGGAPQPALNLLWRLRDAQPALPAVHILLTTVLKDLGQYDDALAANQTLEQLLAA